MNTTTTDTAKVKVRSNDYEIDNKKSDAEHSLKLITQLLLHYESNEVTFSDDEMNAFIRGNFSSSTFEAIAQEKFKDSPKRERRDLIIGFIEDAQMHTAVFQTNYLLISRNVEVKNGKAIIRKNAFQEIENNHTYYISDPKSIELFKKHRELIDAVNALKDEINNHTKVGINSSFLVHFDAVGDAYAPAINYGN